MGVQSITRSYEYSALCDICKFKFKASQLRMRWDGFMVCKWDWEPRHPADFFRGRVDAHKLPWTRSDDGMDPTAVWAAQDITLLSYAVAAGEAPRTSQNGVYRVDTTSVKTTGYAQIALFYTNATAFTLLLNPLSRTTSVGHTLVLPTTPTTGGSIVVRNSYNQVLGTASVTAGSANVTMPSWTSVPGHIFVNFSYGT